jgi:hypothetical protein
VSNPRIRFLGKTFGLWTLGALAIAIPLSRINLVQFYRLRRMGMATSGVVTDLRPGNHRAVYYSYEASGKTFSGIGRAGFGNPEFFCLKVGQTVIVYYLPSAPWESCAGLPNELVENEVPPIIFAGIVFPLFAMAIYSWRYRHFKRWLLDRPK